MKGLYIRWGVILSVSVVLLFLAIQRYDRDVAAVPLSRVLQGSPSGPVRILGIIDGGSLVKDEAGHQATFQLSDQGNDIRVLYIGPDVDALRDLKELIFTGTWNPATREFHATALALLPHYAFVVAAYLIGIIPTVLFLFLMERRVGLLYNEIKQAKIYESEDEVVDQG